MIQSIKNYFHKKSLDERFPERPFHTVPNATRKVGLSMDTLDPMYIYRQIENYYETLHPSSPRFLFLQKWLKLIHDELQDLSKYDLSDVGRIVITQKQVVIFDFYLIYDIHIQEIKTIVIDLDHAVERPTYYSYAIGSMTFAFSLTSIGLLLSNFV